jgi:hypothetical protein
VTPKRTIAVDWTFYLSAPAHSQNWKVEFDDATGTARGVAMDDDIVPALIHHEGRLWSRITRGTAPLGIKAADYAYRCACDMVTTVGFVVFGEDLYRVCPSSPAITVTYNPYHGILRLDYPEIAKPRLIPSDPPEVYFRLDEYAVALGFFDAFQRRVPVRAAYRAPDKYNALTPELLIDQTMTSIRAVLPMIVTALHRRIDLLPNHMIHDWLRLRTNSSLQDEQIDRNELAAVLGRLSRSGFELLEREPERFEPNDWLRRAAQYALMLQLRLQPSGAADEAIEMLFEALK